MCARFRSNVWIQDKLYAVSDRRVKQDIETLDFSLDHYKQLRPVTFRFKNEGNTKLGLIAQELLPICREALMFSENERLTVDGEGDIEGVQLGVDYTAITMMNTVAIKK